MSDQNTSGTECANGEARIAWWRESRFGMFIHWGPYSTYGGEYRGKICNGYTEHIMLSFELTPQEYRSEFSEKLNPINFDADKWVSIAKAAGMKYMVITAKHHDGFSLFRSDAYPYDIRLSKYDGDPMKELSDACRRQGMRFGFYYSHANDWEHPDASGQTWSKDPDSIDCLAGGHGQRCWDEHPELLPRLQKYVNEKAIPQITELITRYAPDLMWFDTPHHLPASENIRICLAVREIDPNLVINGRLASENGVNLGDYVNTADRAGFFLASYEGDWEAIPTTNESYGYKTADNLHKPPIHFVQLLASAAARGGNLLLNIGPKGDGSIDDRDIEILNAIGSWADVNGDSIYGTTRNPLARQCWGEVTRKETTLYLHVFKWPTGGKLLVGGVEAGVKRAYLLADPAKSKLVTQNVDGDIEVTIPADAPDTMDSVIVLELDAVIEAVSVPLVMSAGVETDLMVFDSQIHGEGARLGNGEIGQQGLQGWTTTDQSLSWTFRLIEPATFKVALSYNTAHDNQNGTVYLTVDRQTMAVEYTAFVPVVEKDEHGRLRLRHTTLLAGHVTLSAGEHALRLTAGEYTGDVLMQPLFVTLNPDGSGESSR